MKKKILIFGGTGAIGCSLAKKIKEDEYDPIIIARNEEELKYKAKEIDCEYYICDVLNFEQIEEIAKKYNGDVFGLAYCIGSINLKPLKICKNEDYIESFKINTLGAINSIKTNLTNLNKNNGSILLFSTIAVQQGFTNHSIVSSSKGAIEGLTLSLADSKMSQKILSNETMKKAIENMHPIPKIGEGGDFGELGSFLLSERNRWITGQIFHIDGGRSTLRIKA